LLFSEKQMKKKIQKGREASVGEDNFSGI